MLGLPPGMEAGCFGEQLSEGVSAGRMGGRSSSGQGEDGLGHSGLLYQYVPSISVYSVTKVIYLVLLALDLGCNKYT